MAPITIPIDDWASRIFAWCLSLTALVLSCLAASSCRFVRVTSFDSGANTYSISLGGIYQFYDGGTGQCVSYSLPLNAADPTDPDRLELSGSHKAAKAFAVIAAFLAGTATFVLLAPLLRTLKRGIWRTAGGCLAFSALFQSLTFLIFNDDNCKTGEVFPNGGGSVRCSLDKGSTFAIAAIVIGLLGAAVVCRTPPPEEEPLVSFRSGGEREADKAGGGADAAPGSRDAFVDEQQEAHPDAPRMTPYGASSHHSSASGAAAQFRPSSATPPPTSQQQQQAATAMGARRTVTETVNPDGSKTVFITTTMDGGGGGGGGDPAPRPPPTASSTASSSGDYNARYGGAPRHSRGGSGGAPGDLGQVGAPRLHSRGGSGGAPGDLGPVGEEAGEV